MFTFLLSGKIGQLLYILRPRLITNSKNIDNTAYTILLVLIVISVTLFCGNYAKVPGQHSMNPFFEQIFDSYILYMLH